MYPWVYRSLYVPCPGYNDRPGDTLVKISNTSSTRISHNDVVERGQFVKSTVGEETFPKVRHVEGPPSKRRNVLIVRVFGFESRVPSPTFV